MSLRIAVVGGGFRETSFDASAGSEVAAYQLASELKSRGHIVGLAGCVGSSFFDEQICEVPPAQPLIAIDKAAGLHHLLVNEERLLVASLGWRPDLLIYSGSRWEHALPFLSRSSLSSRCAVIAHGVPRSRTASQWGCPIFAVSHWQRERMIAAGYSVVGVVSNGILPWTKIEIVKESGYLVWIGRFVRSKGAHNALEVARRLEWPLELAGSLDSLSYFREEIAPFLTQRVRYRSALGRSEKLSVLSGASVCLQLPEAPETFGLVALEAMSVGTPVVAFNCGALAEVLSADPANRLVAPGDVQAATEAASEILATRPRTNSALVSEKFPMSAVADRLLGYLWPFM